MQPNLTAIDEVKRYFNLEGYKGLLGKKSLYWSIVSLLVKLLGPYKKIIKTIHFNSERRLEHLVDMCNIDAACNNMTPNPDLYNQYDFYRNMGNQAYWSYVNDVMNRGR